MVLGWKLIATVLVLGTVLLALCTAQLGTALAVVPIWYLVLAAQFRTVAVTDSLTLYCTGT